jgi:hypothetical protein
MWRRTHALLGLCLVAAGAAAQDARPPSNVSDDPRELHQALNALRVDSARVYYVHDLTLRRQGVSLAFSEGRLAFLTPLHGRVTGAVFAGRGRVLATPRDPAEKRSLARFLGMPLLDQAFSRAYMRFTDDTAAEIERRMRDADVQPASDSAFGESWAAAAADLNPWHSLRVMVDWLSTDPQSYFYAGLVGDVSGLFDVLVDSQREERVLLGQAHLVNGESFYDVWASFTPANSPEAPREPFIPLSYAIETTIGADVSLEGKATVRLRVARGGERLIGLELSRFLRVESVSDSDGRLLVFFQNEDVKRQEVARRGNDSLHVVLREPAREGQELELHFSYAGSVISDAGNGVYFVGARGSWYPHISGADHFVPMDLSFRWPKRLTLVATGTKTEERQEGETRVGHWRSAVPEAVAGFNLGEYITRVVGAGSPEIGLFANRQLEDSIVARLRHNNASSLVPILPRDAFPPFSERRAEIVEDAPLPLPSPGAVLDRLGGDILDSIRYLEKLNGPFPFDHLEVSQIPGSFGQGWPGLLYLSTLAFLPPEAQQRAGVSPPTRQVIQELMPFHEVAHQWWGNVVGSAGYRDAWIDEAMANYLALLYADSKRPGHRVLANFLERFRSELTVKQPGTDETLEGAGPLSLGFRLSSSKSPDAYDTVIYGKGAWVIHMLRMMLRDPAAKNPDARFGGLLQAILSERRYRSLSTTDFERAVERVMTPAMDLEGNRRMEWFFDEWVRDVGIPRYAVEFHVHPAGKDFVVRGTLRQSDVSKFFIAAVPLYAQRPGNKPAFLGTVVTVGPETRFQFTTPIAPRHILIDPQLTLLCRTAEN